MPSIRQFDPELILTSQKLGFDKLPAEKPTFDDFDEAAILSENAGRTEIDKSQRHLLQELHVFLVETEVVNAQLECANCRHQYTVREGIANFLLPSHLGERCHYKSLDSITDVRLAPSVRGLASRIDKATLSRIAHYLDWLGSIATGSIPDWTRTISRPKSCTRNLDDFSNYSPSLY